jgi:hypothetical protein
VAKKGATMKKSDAAKLKAKNKFAYKPSTETYFSFIPSKQDLQIMIKKATTIKDADEIVIDSFAAE